jgi:RHS repeat-associated protein
MYEERNHPSGTVLFHQDFTWSQTPTSANPYISTTQTTLDPTQTYQAVKKTVQDLDQYGNLLHQYAYDFGSPPTLARTYTNTYLTSTNYTSRYIFNRLVTSTVVDPAGKTATLVTNTYDGGSLTNVSSPGEHDSTMDSSQIYRGNVTASTTPTASSTASYDITGNQTSGTTNGVTTSASITSTTNYALPSQITTGTLSSSLSYTALFGVSSQTGPNGDGGTITYDSYGRPASSLSPNGATTTYGYHETSSPPYRTSLTNGRWIRTTLDGFGRTIKTEIGTGDTVTGTVTSKSATMFAPCGCSPLGKLFAQSQPYAPSPTNKYWTVYAYDGSGRTLSKSAADYAYSTTAIPSASNAASKTTYVYQGNTVTVTDPAGKWKKFTMDAFGNLTSVVEPDPALGNVTTTYTYDVMNHLTTVSMPRGSNTQTRTFTYNSGTTVGGFLLSATNPENGTVTYTYSNGRMASKTDAKGQQLTYQYDSYGRLTSVTWANAPGGSKVLRTYSFDTNPVDSTFSQNALGRLTAVQYATLAGQVRMIDMFSYVAAGTNGGGKIATKRLQVNEDVTWVDSLGGGHSASPKANLDIGYTYDNEGRTTAMSYPSTGGTGIGYNYSYDSLKRLSGMTDFNSATVVSSVSYGTANELLGMNYSGYSESRSYNSLLQLTDLTVSGPTTHYVFPSAGSNAGKISSQKIGTSGEEVQYTYDSLNRLITASTSSASDANGNTAWGQSFGYDAFGSLTAKTTTKGSPPVLSVAIDPATNRIVGSSYDSNGNVTGGYIWDAENRLIGVPSSATAYGYDAHNKRFFIWDGTTVDGYGGNTNGYTVNVYTPGGQKLGAYQINVVYTGSTYVMGVTLLKSDAYFGGRRVQKQDRLSSVGTYYPYGEEKGPGNPSNDNWKFGTYWRDSLSGLDYADQRFYNSTAGRFMTPDPYMASAGPADPQSWNRYLYVKGDPINLTDRRGLNEEAPEFDPYPFPQNPGGGGNGGGGKSQFADCEAKNVTPYELNFIAQHYAAAAAEAALIQSQMPIPDGSTTPIQINQATLTAALLDWSANESGWGGSNMVIDKNNYFGYGNVSFAPTLSWGAELATILAVVPITMTNPNPGHASYSSFMILGLTSNPNEGVADILQSIANAGYNTNPNYGSDIAKIDIQPMIDCLKKNYANYLQ